MHPFIIAPLKLQGPNNAAYSHVFSTLDIRILSFFAWHCSQVLSAPNILRVGVTENIFVECQDCKEDMTVNIKVMNFPTKTTILAFTSVNLNSGNKYQALGKVKVNNLVGQTDLWMLCATNLLFFVINFTILKQNQCIHL